MAKNILIVGVGGQGTVLASKILTEGLLRLGEEVRMCEIHGMSQRGGSVTTQVKFGKDAYSTSIDKGDADVLISFEKAEAARYLSNLKKDGTLICNNFEIYSLPVLTGAAKYPEKLEEKLKKSVRNFILVDANKIAKALGNERTQNIIILGLAVQVLGLESEKWELVMKEIIPERFHEINIKAFRKGIELGKKEKVHAEV